jgi:hypothetical protein
VTIGTFQWNYGVESGSITGVYLVITSDKEINLHNTKYVNKVAKVRVGDSCKFKLKLNKDLMLFETDLEIEPSSYLYYFIVNGKNRFDPMVP